MLTEVNTLLGEVSGRWNAIKQPGVVIIEKTDIPSSFMTALPFASTVVVEDDADITAAQTAGMLRFIDLRDNTLYETDGSGGYTTRVYMGEDAFFRPMTLTYSSLQNKFYYADESFNLHPVNSQTT